jgi:hypothetical protein
VIGPDAAGDPALASRTWMLLTKVPDGGWGLDGHASADEELVAAARDISKPASRQPDG